MSVFAADSCEFTAIILEADIFIAQETNNKEQTKKKSDSCRRLGVYRMCFFYEWTRNKSGRWVPWLHLGIWTATTENKLASVGNITYIYIPPALEHRCTVCNENESRCLSGKHRKKLIVGPPRLVAIYKQTLIKFINNASRHSTYWPRQCDSWCVFGSFNLCMFVKRLDFFDTVVFFLELLQNQSTSSFIALCRKAWSGRSKRWNSGLKRWYDLHSSLFMFISFFISFLNRFTSSILLNVELFFFLWLYCHYCLYKTWLVCCEKDRFFYGAELVVGVHYRLYSYAFVSTLPFI